MALVIYTDGASSGNPGPMGIGIVIYKDGFRVEELSEYLGIGTNNMAEYTAVIRALETAHTMGEHEVHLKSDSQLVIRQLTGEYQVKDPKLRPLKRKIDNLLHGLDIHFEHIPREKNKEADKLAKDAVEIGKKQVKKSGQQTLG
ncbi:MAG: ribonuclease HI family protein [Candidatus Micrarchaeota archaeon]